MFASSLQQIEGGGAGGRPTSAFSAPLSPGDSLPAPDDVRFDSLGPYNLIPDVTNGAGSSGPHAASSSTSTHTGLATQAQPHPHPQPQANSRVVVVPSHSYTLDLSDSILEKNQAYSREIHPENLESSGSRPRSYSSPLGGGASRNAPTLFAAAIAACSSGFASCTLSKSKTILRCIFGTVLLLYLLPMTFGLFGLVFSGFDMKGVQNPYVAGYGVKSSPTKTSESQGQGVDEDQAQGGVDENGETFHDQSPISDGNLWYWDSRLLFLYLIPAGGLVWIYCRNGWSRPGDPSLSESLV
eukprot:CAMPEP_0178991334 /NCGR_PEP_ID=MMETSP0795-20121207/5462_1 /TAXON_ID=88552 /ORGANISM="Amoebophrya sp., Strain Ameob2" /LENGTH=297 /DNA_ID=CAMNT_0020683015 /DNA_START=125 /DNA_END=1018 /DNA_ORIENTATION=+